jgi:hypothetical protein
MARHEEPGVFDVSKPNKVGPSATSRPVIVGHQPQVSDPMVKDEHSASSVHAKPIPVTVHEHEDKPTGHQAEDRPHYMISSPTSAMPQKDPLYGSQPESGANPHEQELMDHAQAKKHIEPVNRDVKPEQAEIKKPETTEFMPIDGKLDDGKSGLTPQTAVGSEPVVPTSAVISQPLHINGGHRAGSSAGKIVKALIMALLVLLVGGYLAIDAGLVNVNIDLPFRIFGEEETTVTPPPPPPPAPVTPSNLTKYAIADSGISFSYPTAWGTPTTTAERGFSKRTNINVPANQNPDGIFAYLVNFAANKDVQISATSSKYLPPNRAPLYYDYLQWCTGTSDGKIYKSILRFTTVSGSDTPTTITCDQGPLSDAAKLDEMTIVQPKTKDTDGKNNLGDVYTKNLTSTSLPVLRVRDNTSTHVDDIKKLLGSLKVVQTAQTQ